MRMTTQQASASTDRPRRVTVLGGIKIVYLATSEDTGGAYSLFEITTPPGQGPPPHVHTREDESFYVLDGVYNLQVGEQSFTANRGWFGIGPRNIPHALKVAGTG